MKGIGLISIIMAAYNAENTIEKAMNSVLAQTYCNWELIVVNDCSKDNTVSIIQRFALQDHRVRMLENQVNSGVSKTRHYGVEQARGEWIAFLDSDDAWTKDKLEKQVCLQQEKNAELIFTGSNFMDEDGNDINWILHAPEEIGYRKLLKQNLVSNSSVLIRKELFLQNEVIGDEMHEDFACWLRVLRDGRMAYGVDEPLLIYRLSRDSKSGNKLKAAKMNWNTYRAVGLNRMESLYYMVWYTVNGLMKYKHLKR